MTFPLGSASLLLLLCELWCWGRAEALLTNTTTTTTGSYWLGRAQASIVAKQFIRWLLTQNTHRNGHIDTHSVSPAFFYSPPLSILHTQTQKIHRSDKVRQQRCRKKTKLGQRECACQLFLTRFSVSSKVWEAHKVQLPIWQHFQSPNTEQGFFQALTPDGSLTSISPSPLTSFLDTAHVSSQALVSELLQSTSRRTQTHTDRARAHFALYHILRLCVDQDQWHCWC